MRGCLLLCELLSIVEIAHAQHSPLTADAGRSSVLSILCEAADTVACTTTIQNSSTVAIVDGSTVTIPLGSLTTAPLTAEGGSITGSYTAYLASAAGHIRTITLSEVSSGLLAGGTTIDGSKSATTQTLAETDDNGVTTGWRTTTILLEQGKPLSNQLDGTTQVLPLTDGSGATTGSITTTILPDEGGISPEQSGATTQTLPLTDISGVTTGYVTTTILPVPGLGSTAIDASSTNNNTALATGSPTATSALSSLPTDFSTAAWT